MNSRKVIVIVSTVAGVVVIALALWHFVFPSAPEVMLNSSNLSQQRDAVAELSASADSADGIERIAVAARHENPKVACGALRALVAGKAPGKPLPEPAVEVVETATRDSRPVVQLTAVQVLEATTPELPEDTTVPEIVLRTFKQAKTPDVRIASANALGKFQYWQAMEPLLDAMEDDSVEVRSAAGMAVRRILGLDYGFRANAMLADRQAVLARLRREWRSSRRYHEKYAERVQRARRGEQ